METIVKNNLINVHSKDLLPMSHITFLEHLKDNLGFNPTVCYDIGAAVLHWTRHAKRLWPDSEVILFDAFEPASFLYKDYKHHIGVLSDVDNREVKFYQNDLYFGGNSYYREVGFDNGLFFPEDKYILKKTRSLDSVVSENNFPYADLIKIDVQGAELDVIKGASNVLSNAKVLIVEMQHINYNDGAPTVDITKPYIESLGWECIAEKFSDNGPDADYCFIRKV